jgi:hypothetical protein
MVRFPVRKNLPLNRTEPDLDTTNSFTCSHSAPPSDHGASQVLWSEAQLKNPRSPVPRPDGALGVPPLFAA